jgi:hypothetical protein
MAVPLETGVRESSNLIAFLIQQYGKEAVLRGALAELGELEPIDCKAFAEANGLPESLCQQLCAGLPKLAQSTCKARVKQALKDPFFNPPEGDPLEGCFLRDHELICPVNPMPPQPSPGPDPSPIELGQNFLLFKGDFFVRTAAVKALLANASPTVRPASALGGTSLHRDAAVRRASLPQAACGCQTEGLASTVFSRGVQEGGCK